MFGIDLHHCLTLFILMDFPMYVERIRMNWPILYFKGSQVKISKLWCIAATKICFYLWQTVKTLMKCRNMRHFIWVFTVCQSTCFLVSVIKIVKNDNPFYFRHKVIKVHVWCISFSFFHCADFCHYPVIFSENVCLLPLLHKFKCTSNYFHHGSKQYDP